MIDAATLLRAVPPSSPAAPLLEAMYAKNQWLLKPMLEMLHDGMLPEYLREVEEIWGVLRQVRPQPLEMRLKEAIRGLLYHSMEFLKLQMAFAKTGQYQAHDFEAVSAAVYQSQDVMQLYLDGLLLTYIAWPNHYRMLHYYREQYLAHGPYGTCLEIGPGHGWLALEQLRAHPQNRLLGLDISPHSVAYSNALLRAGEIEPSRFTVRQTNANEGIDVEWGIFDRIVVAEVMEHVPDPTIILNAAVGRSHAQTLFFITTVVNIEAVDHIYLFRELQEVRDLLRRCRLEVVSELDLPLKINLPMARPAYEVAMVCRPLA